MTSQRLSIVMPSLNQGSFIGKAIESVINQYQDNQNIELIVRDAMSSDETARVLSNHSDLKWMKVVREPDAGQSDALAKGFEAATGDILCWLNSDDVLLEGAVSNILSAFAASPGTDVVFGEAVFVDEKDQVVGHFPTARPTLYNLRHRCVISQPSVFFRRSAYLAVGGINRDRHYCMDYELWSRLAMGRHTFARVPRVLSGTRLHERTKTSNGGLAFVDEICSMQEELFGDVSPVWRIYQRSRSPALQNQRKWLRFTRATFREVRSKPSLAPLIAAAFGERMAAQISASFRVRRAMPS